MRACLLDFKGILFNLARNRNIREIIDLASPL